ncbi:hypothetical protein BDN70DRAFT_620424 [Pholiota conissans]|uniref:Uncharacterized protein n=1 Tax=Pholiota conissans TaxID=109636 RepID=A0A9P6CV33_9AGAR|nr:hypothetical protein BDN70DRAFT_620424 [Pholiota conissans]
MGVGHLLRLSDWERGNGECRAHLFNVSAHCEWPSASWCVALAVMPMMAACPACVPASARRCPPVALETLLGACPLWGP